MKNCDFYSVDEDSYTYCLPWKECCDCCDKRNHFSVSQVLFTPQNTITTSSFSSKIEDAPSE